MPKPNQPASWPMHHRNQVPIIEDILARINALNDRLNEVAEMFATDTDTDTDKDRRKDEDK